MGRAPARTTLPSKSSPSSRTILPVKSVIMTSQPSPSSCFLTIANSCFFKMITYESAGLSEVIDLQVRIQTNMLRAIKLPKSIIHVQKNSERAASPTVALRLFFWTWIMLFGSSYFWGNFFIWLRPGDIRLQSCFVSGTRRQISEVDNSAGDVPVRRNERILRKSECPLIRLKTSTLLEATDFEF